MNKTEESTEKETKDSQPEFSTYENDHKDPFLVEHFDLGKLWKEKDGGFKEEVDEINSYFEEKINKFEISDSIDAVKAEINKWIKLHDLKHETRKVKILETLQAYVKFLKKTDSIKTKRSYQ